MINTIKEIAASQWYERPENIFAKKDGACEAHVAEKEQAKK